MTSRLVASAVILLGVVALCVSGWFVANASAAEPNEITVAAAADLTDALKQITAGFEKQTGVRVKVVFGSSGNLATQVRNGAPFDVFLSADMDYPRGLVKDGLADGASLFTYTVGALAVLVPADSKVAVESSGLQALLDPTVKRIAIANPAHAPYGRAAQELLKRSGLYDQAAAKLVVGENVAQATQFVISGNAQVGLVSRSQALVAVRSGKFRTWEPPANHPAILQGAVVLSHARRSDAAQKFLEYLKSADAGRELANYGFGAAPGADAEQSNGHK